MHRWALKVLIALPAFHLLSRAGSQRAMPRTYGEITSTSFPKLFELSHGPSTVFIDAGSGHGLLTKAAVEQFQCAFGLGIEKYREPFEKSTQLNATCSPELQSKLRFVLEDILDTEFEQQLAGITFSTILLVCNNLAFMDGTLTRCTLLL